MPPPQRDGAAVTQDPAVWWHGVLRALQRLGRDFDLRRIGRVAVDGTSGTLLLTDAAGHPLTPALMYNDASAASEAQPFEGHLTPRLALATLEASRCRRGLLTHLSASALEELRALRKPRGVGLARDLQRVAL